jgi:hypothetical protein
VGLIGVGGIHVVGLIGLYVYMCIGVSSLGFEVQKQIHLYIHIKDICCMKIC